MKLFGVDMIERFAIRKNVTMSIVAFAVNIIMVFVSYRLVIMHGGLGMLGLWSTLMSWIFIVRIGDVGMAAAATRYIATCHTETEGRRIRTYVDSGIALNGALFIFLAVLGFLLLDLNLDKIVLGSAEDLAVATDILPIMLACFVLSNLSGLVLGALSGIHLAYLAAWIGIGGTLTQLLTVIVLVPKMGLSGLALGQLNQHVLMLVIGWLLFRCRLKKVSGIAGPLLPVWCSYVVLKEMFGFSIKSQVANVLNGFFEPLSKILIGRFAGLEVLGLYEMAYKLVSLPRNAAVSGVQATIPSVTRLLLVDKPEAQSLYTRSLRLVSGAAAVIALVSIVVSPIVSWVVLGNVELSLVAFVSTLAVGFFFNTLGAPAFILGTATGHLKNNILAALLSLLIMSITCIFASGLSTVWPQVASVSLALACGGVFIRWRNEALLKV